MSLFGSLMNDFDDDPFYGAHFRQMRHVNSLMNSLISDPFGTLGEMGVPLPIMGPHPYARSSMMPFMPPPMNMNRLLIGMVGPQGPMAAPGWPQLQPSQAVSPYSGGLDDSLVNGRCNSYSSSTVVMSNGPDGRPQVYSATSSTQMGPGGVKETRQTVQDSRTGTKKMSIGHHINDRAHVIEREQNVRSGDLEEREEFINIEEEEAEDFTREFGQRLRGSSASSRPRPLAITAPPVPSASSSAVRQTYSSLHPQRTKQRNPKHHHSSLDY